MSSQAAGVTLKTFAKNFNPSFEKILAELRTNAAEIHPDALPLFDQLVRSSQGGKRLRPFLVAVGAQLGQPAFSSDISDTITQLGAALELFQSALLIHDDIMDQDDLRRGQPSFHAAFQAAAQTDAQHNLNPTLFGQSMGICGGDLAYYLSWQLLLSTKLPAKTIVALGQLYARQGARVVFGQNLDITHPAPNPDFDHSRIMTMMQLKTAEYSCVFPLEMGAMLAQLPADQMTLLKQYGLALGWAFQIQDDILGMFGDSTKTGKPVGNDLREGKFTLLISEYIKQSNPTQLAALRELLGNPGLTETEITTFQKELENAGVRQKVTDQLKTQVQTAQETARSMDIAASQQQLLVSLADFMVERVA